MSTIRTLILAGLASFMAPPVFAAVSKELIKDVSGELICYCGCANKVVATCGCGTADRIEADIAQQLEAGKTKQEIIAAYVAVHGEKGLATPVKTGFNLTAWIMPILALLSGGAVICTAVVRWRRRGCEKEARRQEKADERTAALVKNQDRILQELEELD